MRLQGEQTWVTIGAVQRPADSTVRTFPAAAHVPASTVAATSAHGIRIRTPASAADPYGISIQPREFHKMPSGYGGHIPGRSAILTDIPSGSAIFREFAPMVGDPVSLENNGAPASLSQGYRPSQYDVLLITTTEPANPSASITFENKVGGAVILDLPRGSSSVIAEVRQPVRGVGRFDGTSFTGCGAINTNHPGVITVSTAPLTRPSDEGAAPERRGGFEIQPHQHAETQPRMPQVMVVAPTATGGNLEGAPPLFSSFLTLGNGSPSVEVNSGDGTWSPMPEAVGKNDEALAAVTAIRINRRPRTLDGLSEALTLAARHGETGAETPAVKGQVRWSPAPPYPAGAQIVIFRSSGRAIAVSNVVPFTVETTAAEGQTIQAEFVAPNGTTLETRTGRVVAAPRGLEVIQAVSE